MLMAERFLANSLTFHFEEHRDSSRPLIVFINGLLADCSSYETQSFLAKEEFHVLTYNCKGQDLAEIKALSSEPYSILNHVEDLKVLIEDIQKEKGLLNNALFLCGLSNGGRIALKFAELNPKKVQAICALDTYSELTPLLEQKLKSWLAATEIGGAVHRFDIATPWIWGETFFREKSDVILSFREKVELADRKGISMNVRALVGGALLKDGNNKIDLLKIKTPVLLLCGEEDLLTIPSEHQKMSAQLKICEYEVLIKTGHASLLENPMLVKNKILPFFKRFV